MSRIGLGFDSETLTYLGTEIYEMSDEEKAIAITKLNSYLEADDSYPTGTLLYKLIEILESTDEEDTEE